MSKGEEKVLEILLKHNLPLEREKTFQDLKGGKFRYDFYLPKHNILIEYNGIQHYQQVEYFHKSRTEFQKAQEHDRRKISYAIANGITIYCIPYGELDNLNNIFDILNPKFEAKNRWYNDTVGREYQNSIDE